MAYLNARFHGNNITINSSQWELTIKDTRVNRKVLMVFLRLLQNPETKKHLFTFKCISDAFEYPDRRNANNTHALAGTTKHETLEKLRKWP